jgi:hypothetical protein
LKRLSQKGAVSVLVIFTTIVFFALGAITADVARHFCIKIVIKYKLNFACRAAAAQVDEDKLAESELVLDESRATNCFFETLRINLKLDQFLKPEESSSIISGPIEVSYLKVVDSSDLPFSYYYGDLAEILDYPGFIAIIGIPVKSGFFSQLIGLPKEKIMFFHVAAAPELSGT